MEGPKKRYPTLSPTTTPGHDEEPTREGTVRGTSVLSRKEFARELRRQAYQRAKQARATDPRHLAMKEAAKVRRREAYQHVKERRKEHEAELKAQRKVTDAAARVETQRHLAERVRSALHGSSPVKSLPVTAATGSSGDAVRATAVRATALSSAAGHPPAVCHAATPPEGMPERASKRARGKAPAREPGEAVVSSSRSFRSPTSSRPHKASDIAPDDMAREMAEALEDPGIRDLMARLRAESARLAELAARHQTPPAGVEEAALPSEGCPETFG
jgi:hypothetical protein